MTEEATSIPPLELLLQKENEGVVAVTFADLFSLGKRAWDLALRLIADEERIGIGNSHYTNLCMAAVFAKQLRLFVASYRLCGHGLGMEAGLTCRAMYETFVNLKALDCSSDSEDYARRWLLWDFARDEGITSHIISRYPGSKSKLAELQSYLKNAKASMGQEKWEEFIWKGPSMLKLNKLCEKLGLSDAHSTFYPIVSGTSHGYDLLSYARPMSDDKIQTNFSPTLDFVDSALATAIAILRDTLAILNFHLHMQKDEIIKDLTNVVQEVNRLMASGPDRGACEPLPNKSSN